MSSRVEQKAELRAEREAKQAAAEAQAERNRRLGILGAVVGAAVVVVVVLILVGSGGDSGPKGAGKGGGAKVAGASQVQSEFAGLPQKGTVVGNPRAPVTMVEFADLQCPFCAQFSSNALPGVMKSLVKAGKVKVELRLLRFIGSDSDPAARAAAAASKQNRMWQFAALFYRNQGQENTGYVTNGFLRKIASGVPGLDVDKLMKDMKSKDAESQVSASDRRAQTLGVDSTPTVYASQTGGVLREIDTSQFSASQVEDGLKPYLK